MCFDQAHASANLGQMINIFGQQLDTTIMVLFTTVNDLGMRGVGEGAITWVSPDGTRAQAVVPTGDLGENFRVCSGLVSLIDPQEGRISARGSYLHIVPTLSDFSAPVFAAGETANIYGSGFVEGQTLVLFSAEEGTVEVATTDVGSGNNQATVIIPEGVVAESVRVETDGGMSNIFFLETGP